MATINPFNNGGLTLSREVISNGSAQLGSVASDKLAKEGVSIKPTLDLINGELTCEMTLITPINNSVIISPEGKTLTGAEISELSANTSYIRDDGVVQIGFPYIVDSVSVKINNKPVSFDTSANGLADQALRINEEIDGDVTITAVSSDTGRTITKEIDGDVWDDAQVETATCQASVEQYLPALKVNVADANLIAEIEIPYGVDPQEMATAISTQALQCGTGMENATPGHINYTRFETPGSEAALQINDNGDVTFMSIGDLFAADGVTGAARGSQSIMDDYETAATSGCEGFGQPICTTFNQEGNKLEIRHCESVISLPNSDGDLIVAAIANSGSSSTSHLSNGGGDVSIGGFVIGGSSTSIGDTILGATISGDVFNFEEIVNIDNTKKICSDNQVTIFGNGDSIICGFKTITEVVNPIVDMPAPVPLDSSGAYLGMALVAGASVIAAKRMFSYS